MQLWAIYYTIQQPCRRIRQHSSQYDIVLGNIIRYQAIQVVNRNEENQYKKYLVSKNQLHVVVKDLCFNVFFAAAKFSFSYQGRLLSGVLDYQVGYRVRLHMVRMYFTKVTGPGCIGHQLGRKYIVMWPIDSALSQFYLLILSIL